MMVTFQLDCYSLKDDLSLLLSEKQLKAAGMGNSSNFLADKLIRSDVIFWLDRKEFSKDDIGFH